MTRAKQTHSLTHFSSERFALSRYSSVFVKTQQVTLRVNYIAESSLVHVHLHVVKRQLVPVLSRDTGKDN